MFARILDCAVKTEKKEEFVKVVKNEILPILKNQTGFLEILPFVPEHTPAAKFVAVSLWTTKSDAERYERTTYARILEIAKPFLSSPVTVNEYKLETTVCKHFVDALVA